MVMISGIPVTLTVQTQTGTDAFNAPIYTETTETVNNVLVAPATDQEILDTINLYGRKAVYTLGIPKGDTHTWTNTVVTFWGQKWRTIGEPLQGIEDLIPLEWNKKVRVETYVEDPAT